jgi:xylulokinase
MLFLGIHIGETAARAVVANRAGEVAAEASVAHPAAIEAPAGWSEHKPAAWWDGAAKAAAQVVKALGPARTREIKAVGLSGMPNAYVLFDEMAQVIRPAMAGGPSVAEKLAWLQEHEPEAYGRIFVILPAKDYIRFRMTGAYATDRTEALTDGAMKESWRPRVYEGTEQTGQVLPGIGALTGMPMWIPVVAGTSDAGGDGRKAAALAAAAVK